MKKSQLAFIAGVLAVGGAATIIWFSAPPPEHAPGPALEQKLRQSEKKIERLLAEIEHLRQDRLWFDNVDFTTLPNEQPAEEILADVDTDAGLPGPVNESAAFGDATQAYDENYRSQMLATAGNAYQRSVTNPDAVKASYYLKQARNIYSRAGAPYRAIEIQQELMQRYPDPDPYQQLVELAALKRTVGDLDEAITSLDEAINTTPMALNKLNGMQLSARYKEQRFGSEAGISAWMELQQYASSIGHGDSGPAQEARIRIEQLQQAYGLIP